MHYHGPRRVVNNASLDRRDAPLGLAELWRINIVDQLFLCIFWRYPKKINKGLKSKRYGFESILAQKSVFFANWVPGET